MKPLQTAIHHKERVQLRKDRFKKIIPPITLLYLLFLLLSLMTMPTGASFYDRTTIDGTISVTDSIYGSVTDSIYGQSVTDLIYGGTVTHSIYDQTVTESIYDSNRIPHSEE